MTTHDATSTRDEAALTVDQLRGRSVWTEAGDRLGSIRDVHADGDGRVVSFDVQQRWILGPHRTVPASGMRLDGSDVIVPGHASEPGDSHGSSRRVGSADGDAVAARSVSSTAPVILGGRDAARARFGGGDLLASLGGALAALSIVVILGSVLASVFATDGLALDTSITAWPDLLEAPWLLGAVTLAVASLVGGWVAGRSARYDGARNGVLGVVWLLVLGAASVLAGIWFGDRYDVASTIGLPNVEVGSSDELATAGVLGLLLVLGAMLLMGALGGAIGAAWHRRADRAMFERVPARDGDGDIDRTDGDRGFDHSGVAHPATQTDRRDQGLTSGSVGSPMTKRRLPGSSDDGWDSSRPR